MAKKSIYLIEPKADTPSYHGAEVVEHLGYSPMAFIANLVLTTIAALVPDDFEVTLCDEHITPVDLDNTADFIGITGKNSQLGRMLALAEIFKKRGKVVIIGGPYASLVPEAVRPYCDILVQGELEALAPQLFADLLSGQWKTTYHGGQPDLSLSPIPRWDLYPNESALSGCVQTSRGCPFECEFCDVIQYAGRNQRHKPVDQILAELDVLYETGHNNVFISDDNFTVYRRRTKELLIALRDWNYRQSEGQLSFSTQVSIDIARDSEILTLCAEAGINYVFIGIETPNEASLRETKKRQNVGINLTDQVQCFLDHGIAVTSGMIVGFDSDGPDIFERQYQFAKITPIPVFSLGALVAPEATPLYDRLNQANRLLDKTAQDMYATSSPWQTNIVPEQMTQAELLEGLRWLCNRIYDPTEFGRRVLQFIDQYQAPPGLADYKPRKPRRHVQRLMLRLMANLSQLGEAEAAMMTDISKAFMAKPEARPMVMYMMFQYAQIRHMYQDGQFWDTHLAQQTTPMLA